MSPTPGKTEPGARLVRGTAAVLLLALPAVAQDADAGLERLKAILASPVIAATRQSVPIRESPGIITLLTREEIRASGARDLLEVLRMVPGLDFGSDTNDVVGIGVRGNWGHDGKVLLLVDGLEMNEPLYGTTAFGGHYPVGDVDRIEIIRGPGSAQYGGYAELAVIQVFTRPPGSGGTAEGDLWLGRLQGADLLARQGQVRFSGALGPAACSVSYARGEVPQGSGPYATAAGTLDTGPWSQQHQDFLNLGLSAGGLNLRYLRDRYFVRDYTRWYRADVKPLSFPGQYFGADWTWSAGDLTLRPEFQLKQQSPWMYTDARTDRNTRGVGRLIATWKATPALNLSAGVEAVRDDASIYWSARGYRQHYIHQNRAALLQALWSLPFGNLDLGVRHDRHSEFGSATSPRLAFTHAEDGWHVKLLAAGAFRAPSIENLFVNPALRPERTHSYEAEGGIALGRHSYLSANVFFERIHDPISYANPAPGVNTYLNFDHVGSRGLELDLQTRARDLTLRATFTLQEADDRNADFYRVPGEPAYHVGFPRTKAALQVQWRFRPGWSLNPEILAVGRRFAYGAGGLQPAPLGAATYLNLFLSWRLAESLEAGLRASNLLDEDAPYIQPYGNPGAGGTPPLPGARRSLDLRLSFRF
ncbi:MAG TPA: TonB-dependent receptor plug domain-containing protein [Holophaga sp.]|nr:TonB-dependent receptor plug domain-containing protein [Holophaga sp.]